VSPDLLAEADWDTLATAAQWARAHADLLRDSHWVGGDPARDAIYGWASWAPEGAILALRNPSAYPQRITLDVAATFELPSHAPHRFRITRRHGPAIEGVAPLAGTRSIELPAHAVVVWDLAPLR